MSPRPSKGSSPHGRALGRKRLKLRPWKREIINGSTPHGLRDENLRLRASAPWSEMAAAPGARLVHLLVTHDSFGIPQTSLGGFGM